MKNYRFLFILFCFLFSGCHFLEKPVLVKAFSKKKIAKKARAQEKQTWAQIQNLKAQSPAEYIKAIDRFIEENKDKEIVLPAYVLKAKILLKNRKASQACLVYHKVVKLPFYYTNKWKAYRESAKCYFKEGKVKRAVEVLENLIRDPKEAVANKERVAQLQWSF